MQRLILRLSSLGDVVLSTAALSVTDVNDSNRITDWVVLKEYSQLLQGHPALRKIWSFDRMTGLKGWISLSRQLWEQNYTEIIDLHRSIRTCMLRILFYWFSIHSGKKTPVWKKISKTHWKYYGLYIFKNLWPKIFYPLSVRERFSLIATNSIHSKPDLSHLVKNCTKQVNAEKYYCVMPSSKWIGKQWPVEYFFRVLQELSWPLVPMILGSPGDEQSYKLVELLKSHNIKHISFVGEKTLTETASILANAECYLGCDTGLAHLAEAVGTKAIIVYGPTVPEMGFGPWRKESITMESSLWCRPCGKDGRYCFRFFDKYRCLHEMTPEMAIHELLKFLKE